MKVAIIAPPYPLEEAPAPPLGVSYVAAAFERAGAEVRIFDYIVSRYTPEKLKAQLDAFQPDAVGGTSVTLNFPAAAQIVSAVKEHNPDIVTMMGGPHVSFDAEGTLNTYPGIDLIVRGEGEDTIAELLPALKERKKWKDILGLSFRDNGSVTETGTRPFIPDLDDLPLPARHLLPLSRYQALGYPVSIITSRGCPYSCIFCQGRRMVGKKVRQRTASRVVDEIEHILSYGIDRINVADDLFVSNKKKVRDVCDEIRRRGLKFTWSAFARVNTVDPETLALMRDNGCDSISYGVESGNQGMLDMIRKGITLEQVRKAVKMCLDAGMVCHTSFIAGLPGETMETLKETDAFAQGLGAMYGYHILAPFPGTTVREEVDSYDLEILTSDWSLYDANRAVARTSALAPADIERFVAEFEGAIDEEWQRMIRDYRNGTASPYALFRVEGHFRTQLIFKILAGDLVETLGTFPAEGGPSDSLAELCRRIQAVADEGLPLVEKVIGEFVGKGFLKVERQGDRYRWFWTHNNRVDHL
ncbi:MAG: radical SAM protein [Syntrophaceae bacterium]|nr:radical SAM protein [Syntrophaceae bacterium]